MKHQKRSRSGKTPQAESKGQHLVDKPSRPAQSRSPQTPWADRHFTTVLIGLCLAGLVIRGFILAGYCGTPLALHPINDGKVYWEWAGDIAAGKLVLDHPFFSAPLYPYLLGTVRWLGAQTTFVYVLQMLGDLAAVALLAWVSRRRFGANVALLAAALYLLLLEPASAMLRVLASSLHLLLVVLTWAALVRVQERLSWGRLLAAGAALGFLSLAYAPAILLLPTVAVWLFVLDGRKPASALKALFPPVVAVVIIAPATIHNWHATGGFFPIQAGGGITLLQGNYATSTGSYTMIPGVTPMRQTMHEDTRKVYQEATGRDPNWVDVERYFRGQALDFWRSHPIRLFELLARKFYLFVSSRHYADIYQPTGEIAQGINTRLRLAPLPLPWLICPAFVGLVLMLRKPAYHAPEWMLFVVPLFVVLTFFYSSRYRVPAIPVIVLIAAWLFVRVWDWRSHWPALIAALGALAVGIGLESINQRHNIDRPSATTTLYNLGYALHQENRLEEAIVVWRKGLAIDPNNTKERITLGELLAATGQYEESVTEFRRALPQAPHDATLKLKLARSYLGLRRAAEADELLTAAAREHADNALVFSMLASAKHLQHQDQAACQYFEQALRLAPKDLDILADYGNALVNLRRWSEAQAQFEKMLAIDPNNFLAVYRLGVIAGHFSQYDDARRRLERAHAMHPSDVDVIYDMGYLELRTGNQQEAARLMREALDIDPNYRPAKDKLQQIEQQ